MELELEWVFVQQRFISFGKNVEERLFGYFSPTKRVILLPSLQPFQIENLVSKDLVECSYEYIT